jgi:transglutaminase-like putative cysteine protease
MHTRRLPATTLAVVFLSLLALPLSAGLFRADFQPVSPAELSMTSTPIAPGASAVVLEWTHHQDDTESYEEEYVRTKIFTDEGKKHADVELRYVPGFTDIAGIRARTVHADGTIAEFDGKMYNKLILRSGRVRVMAKTFTLPDVRPGSVIEYRYRRSWPLNLLLTSRWTLQRDLPVLKEQVWLKPYEKEYSSFFSYVGLPPGKAPVRVKDHYVLDLENMPAYEEEPHSPPAGQVKPRIDFYYQSGHVTDGEAYWKETANAFAKTIEDFIGDRKGIKTIAQQLVADAATPQEKLRKIYARVQQLRNLSYEKDQTEQEQKRANLRDNNNPEDVLRNGYGNRDELTRTFIALARAAGFEASDIAVAPRDEYFFTQQLLDSGQLTGEVAMVVVDGKPLFLDPGTPFAPFGMVSWEYTNVQAMRVVRKTNAAQWIDIPEGGKDAAVTKRQADLHLDGDVLKGTVTITWSGQAALVHRLAGRNDDDAANRKTIEDEVKGLLPDGATAKVKTLSAMKEWDTPLVAVLDVELPNVSTATGSRTLVPLSVFGVGNKNPFPSEQRKSPVYYLYSWQHDDEVTLHLPEGYKVEGVPTGVASGGGAIGFTTKFAATGDTVTMKRQLFVNTILIDPKNYSIIRRFFSNVNTADQDALVLRKNAAAKGTE